MSLGGRGNMAGPNDVGVLRGVIGDGVSMNDEELREKVYGKRRVYTGPNDHMHMPVEKKHLINTTQTNFNASNALDKFVGKGRVQENPVNKLAQFTGKNIQQSSSVDRLSYFMKNNDAQKFNPQAFVHSIHSDKHSNNWSLWGKDKDAKPEQPVKGPAYVQESTPSKDSNKGFVPIQSLGDARNKGGDDTDTSPTKYVSLKALNTKIAKDNMPQPGEEAGKALSNAWKDKPKGTAIFSASKILTPLGNLFVPDKSSVVGKAATATANAVSGFKKGIFGSSPTPVVGSNEWMRQAAVKEQRKEDYKSGWLEVAGVKGLNTRQSAEKFQNFMGGIAENLGPKISGGAILASPAQGGDARAAALALKQYQNTLAKKHGTAGFNQVTISRMTINEQQRYNMFAKNLEGVQQRGFLSGGRQIISQSTPQQPMGMFAENTQQIGGIMDVSQGLRTEPNKWNVLLGQSQNTASSDKITRILGKQPDPTGLGESAAAKIKRLSGL